MSTEVLEQPVVDDVTKPVDDKKEPTGSNTNNPAVDEKKTSGEQAARMKAIDLAVEQIEKQFGAGSIMKLGEGHKIDICNDFDWLAVVGFGAWWRPAARAYY